MSRHSTRFGFVLGLALGLVIALSPMAISADDSVAITTPTLNLVGTSSPLTLDASTNGKPLVGSDQDLDPSWDVIMTVDLTAGMPDSGNSSSFNLYIPQNADGSANKAFVVSRFSDGKWYANTYDSSQSGNSRRGFSPALGGRAIFDSDHLVATIKLAASGTQATISQQGQDDLVLTWDSSLYPNDPAVARHVSVATFVHGGPLTMNSFVVNFSAPQAQATAAPCA